MMVVAVVGDEWSTDDVSLCQLIAGLVVSQPHGVDAERDSCCC